MEEYVKEAPQTGSVSNRRLEYQVGNESPEEQSPKEENEKQEEEEEKPQDETEQQPEEPELLTTKEEAEPPPLISTEDDLLGLNELNPKAQELEESNALALAIIPPGGQPAANTALSELGAPNATGWELALVTAPTNISQVNNDAKLAGGFDKLLLDSLYEDESARRQIQLQNAGYGYGMPNPFEQQQQQQDPFVVSNSFAPPTHVQMAMLAQQHQVFQQQNSQQTHMVPYQNQPQYYQQMQPAAPSPNPFGDPFGGLQQNTTPQHGNHGLL